LRRFEGAVLDLVGLFVRCKKPHRSGGLPWRV
jgi:hypothetical protein